MNGYVIPNTPIAVDFWKIRECPHARVFFLTHLHGDHTVGLSSSWQHKIHCSEVTANLLREKYEVDPALVGFKKLNRVFWEHVLSAVVLIAKSDYY